MTSTATREAGTMTEITTHVLRLKWSTSRGRDTYGWNIVTLTDETTGKKYRANGGGYDMVGTVFASWLLDVARVELLALPADAKFYGLRRHAGGGLSLDGACGHGSMVKIARAIGADVTRTYDRKGNTTGWLVTLPA